MHVLIRGGCFVEIRALPDDARQLLTRLNVPPRLVAHLALVHDVAADILKSLQAQWPNLSLDKDAVLFGAATHDIGKVLHPAELVGPGSKHERDGPGLLEQMGIPADRCRFTRTHGTWKQEATLALEDMVVALADTCWKGKRDEELESRLASRIAGLQGIEKWEAFLALDEIVERIAAHAEERLAWQSRCNR
jgi:HD domain